MYKVHLVEYKNSSRWVKKEYIQGGLRGSRIKIIVVNISSMFDIFFISMPALISLPLHKDS